MCYFTVSFPVFETKGSELDSLKFGEFQSDLDYYKSLQEVCHTKDVSMQIYS